MAQRPIFIPELVAGSIRQEPITFQWFPGFSIEQKQRSIRSLHKCASTQFGWDPNYILEVSTKSHQGLGVRLSAFNLTLPCPDWYRDFCPESPDSLSLESVYQGSKVFADGRGPHQELYSDSPRKAKRFIRENGMRAEVPVSFCYGDVKWLTEPGQTTFYDYLYLRALRHADAEHRIDIRSLDKAVAFTDIEFNPSKSLNCQARSCALFVVLNRHHLLEDALKDLTSFREATCALFQEVVAEPQLAL